jgi:hypothetical protein
MYRETAGLVMYGQLGKDSILMKLGSLVEKMEHDDSYSREELVRAIYDEVYRLLDLITIYGSVTLLIFWQQQKIHLVFSVRRSGLPKMVR